MNKLTLSALKESIAHWEANAIADKPEQVRIGVKNCALCSIFFDYGKPETECCAGCPVRNKVGLSYCKLTPYHRSLHACWKWEDSTKEEEVKAKEEFQKEARIELSFLKSLLPVSLRF